MHESRLDEPSERFWPALYPCLHFLFLCMLSLILFQLLFVATVYNGYIIVRTRSLFSIPPISIKNFAPPRFRDKAKSNEIGICIDIEMKPAALFHRPEMFFFKLRAGSNAATQRFDQDAHQLNTQRLVS